MNAQSTACIKTGAISKSSPDQSLFTVGGRGKREEEGGGRKEGREGEGGRETLKNQHISTVKVYH